MIQKEYVHASFCTGIGACELAAMWMGWRNAFSCEIDPFCHQVLKYYYPHIKHYGNIFGTDFSEWRGKNDILTAGFPCQPFSCAGSRKGAEDDRYLWPEVLRGVDEIRPNWFIGENVAGITSMVLPGDEIKVESYTDLEGESYLETEMRQQFIVDRICNDLESIGYSVQPLLYRLVPSVRRIEGTESGLLPTVQTQGLKVCNKGKTEFMNLKLLPTPIKSYWKPGTPKDRNDGKTRDSQLNHLIAHHAGKTSHLNPLFVSDMMGFPIMWCDI